MNATRSGLHRSAPIPLACGLIAIAVAFVAVFSVISLQDNDVTALIRMGGGEPISPLARELYEDFEFVERDAHYDGVYYFAIGIDPLALGEAHDLIDLAAYRYSHPGYGWLAWAASLGNPRLVALSLALVGFLSFGGAAVIASIVAREQGWSEWGGLVVALNPGLIYAVLVDTGEAFGVLLLGLLFLAWSRQRWVAVAVLSVALSLTKEMFLFACAGFFLWRCICARRGNKENLFAALASISIGPLAFAIWQIYVYSHFDLFPYAEVPPSLFLPLAGWAESMTLAAGKSLSTADSNQIGSIAVPLIVAVGGLLAAGMYQARRLRSEFDAVFLFLAAMAFSLGPLQLTYPKDLLRLTATQLVLVPLVLAGSRASAGSRSASELP